MKDSADSKHKDDRFELLRELLLDEDRKRLHELKQEVILKERTSARISPIIDEKIDDLRKKFPEYFGDTITKTIKSQIKNSQDEMVDALYPIMGKLIKKAIVVEIQRISDNINQKVKSTFSFKDMFKRFKRKASGVSEGEAALQNAFQPAIEEVFIIAKDSGLLLGSHSTGNIADKDMVSGMLTAIKSFAEDAFSKEGQDLEDIGFETFDIILNNFNSIYIAIAVSGVQTPDFKDELNDKVYDLAEIILGDRSNLENEVELNNLIVKYLIDVDNPIK